MPAPIVISNLTPQTKMGNESPKIATRADLRDGSRGDSGGDPGSGGGSATELANGQTITITGTGFGSVANPKPSAYDDWTGYGALGYGEGDLVPEGVKWGINGGPFHDQMVLTSENVLPGRTFCAKSLGPKTKLQDLTLEPGAAPFVRGAHYMTYLFAANESLDAQPKLNRSDKWHRCADHPDYTRISFEPNQAASAQGRIAIYDGQPTSFFYPEMGTAKATTNTLHRVEQWVIASNLWISINGRINGPYPYQHKPEAPSDLPMRMTLIGHDVSQRENVNETLRTFIAEVYEQPTPARVEISNSSVFDGVAEQKRYYQRCDTRTDSAITIPSLFLADLDASAPLYAHIVKDDGSVNTVELVIGTNVEIA